MDLRVLMFSWEYPPVIAGGLARHVAALSRCLVAEGVDVDVVTRGAPGVRRADGVVVHRVAQAPFPADLDAFLAWVADLNVGFAEIAEGLIADGPFDLVHGHDWLVADAARVTARRLGCPWLVTVHATEHGRHAGRVFRHPQSTIHAAERAMAQDADRVITCSSYMADHISTVLGVPRARIAALRNGVDLGAPAPGVAWGLRRRLAPGGGPLVLLAGRLVHEKGFHRALEALATVIDARPGVRFLVAGSGPAEAGLRRQAHALGLTPGAGEFLGWVDEQTLRGLFALADVCLVPSLYEPFGIVALEAMAGGCPCVVSDTGGLREIVGPDGEVGLRVPAGDAAALANATIRLLEDDRLRARIAAAAREHVRRFDWSEVARATRAVYAHALAAPAVLS